MTKIQKLEHEVKSLTPQELVAFRDWFSRFDCDQWDQEIEKDVLAGKLDGLAREAIREHRAGRSKEL